MPPSRSRRSSKSAATATATATAILAGSVLRMAPIPIGQVTGAASRPSLAKHAARRRRPGLPRRPLHILESFYGYDEPEFTGQSE